MIEPTSGSASRATAPGVPVPSAAALGFAMAFPTVLTIVYFVALSGAPRELVQAVYAAGKCVQFGFPLAWMAWRRVRFPRPAWPGRRGAGAGLVFGVAVFAAALGLYHAVLDPVALASVAEAVREKLAALGVATVPRFVALAAFYSIAHAAAEEWYWRGFVFGGLRRGGRLPAALAVSSVGFAAHHVVILGVYFGWTSPWTALLALAVAAGGAFWAWLYQRSGSLLGPWIGHLLVDAALFAVGYGLAFG